MESDDERTESEQPPLGDIPALPAIEPSRSGWLGRRRRMMVLVVAAIGLTTLFAPLIRTDSPVLGRTQWSPLQIAIDLEEGTLPPCSGGTFSTCADPRTRAVFLILDAVLGFGSMYALLFLIAAAALVFPRRNLVGMAAMLGMAPLYVEARRHNYPGVQDFLYGDPFAGPRAHAGALELIFLGVFALLLWIAVTKALDY